MKYLLITILFISAISCSDDTPSDPGNPDNPDLPMDDSPFEEFYAHDNFINKIAVAGEDRIAIKDFDGIFLKTSEETRIDNFQYSIGSNNFNVYETFTSRDMEWYNDELYVGTGLGSFFIRNDNGDIRALPIRVDKMHQMDDGIYGVWDVFELFPGPHPEGKLVSKVNITDLELDYGSAPCLDVVTLDNPCGEFDFEDFASASPKVMSTSSTNTITIPNLNDEGFTNWTLGFSDISFFWLKEIEYFKNAESASDTNSTGNFDHIWLNTNNGFAFYKIDQDWTELILDKENWNYLTPDNSELRHSNIEQMEALDNNRLIAYGNIPDPTIYYVNVSTQEICAITEGIDSDIRDLYIDRDPNNGHTIYIGLRKSIIKTTQEKLEENCGF